MALVPSDAELQAQALCLSPASVCAPHARPHRCHVTFPKLASLLSLASGQSRAFHCTENRVCARLQLVSLPRTATRDLSCTVSLALCTFSQARSRSSSRPPPSCRRLSENSLVKGLPAVCTNSPKACLTGRGLGRTGVKALGMGYSIPRVSGLLRGRGLTISVAAAP